MTIKIGDRLPEGELRETIEVESQGCAVGPQKFNVGDLVKGKKIAVFGVPGAFTGTCSTKHAPPYIQHAAEFKAKGVDEIWCMAVNDPSVMGAWGRDLKATGIVRMMADGNGDFARALGLELDLRAAGMGMRSRRFSMLVDDGVVKQLNLEEGGKFAISGADTLLAQIG